ncbi:hypothetical protein I550_5188 [Mycobacterium intracellulare 1956]|uniref:YibE/F-like family protein n=1 Tax=Mycobacterium intracellulare 1956 TaxID=1299331 RepID=X8CB24_MYCIT|nr:hypothetical protein I550_5188 [Mycobacterium intracellulare 1956]
MTHSHSHSLPPGPSGIDPLPARIVVGLLVAIGVAVAVGAILLWPSRQRVDIPMPLQNASGGAVSTQAGHVLSSGLGDCGSPSVSQVLTGPPKPAAPGAGRCVLTQVAVDSGPNAGATTLLESSPGPGQPKFAVGDRIRVVRQVDDQGATSYAFYDFERGWALVGLAIAFAVVIVAVARWRGLLALVGILVAFVVLVMFLLPALRDGAPRCRWRWWRRRRSSTRSSILPTGSACGPAPRCWAPCRLCCLQPDYLGRQYNWRISPVCRTSRTPPSARTWATCRSVACCWPVSSSGRWVCSTM